MASILQRESSFCDKDQNDTIVRALYEQKQSSTFCDVVMKVCGRDIYAHSNILAAASPYFSQFLGQDLPRQFSQRGPQVIEIQIDGSEPNMMYEEAVASVIDFIYTGRMTVRESNAAQIIEIARIMQMENIVKFCEDFIAGRTPAGTTILDGQPYLYRDGSVNTEKSFDVNQRVQMVDFITSLTEPPLIQAQPKVKPSKMLSVATQVMPQLLGLKPDNSQTRDISTSTDRRLFEHLSSSQCTTWRGPGRKPNYIKNTGIKRASDVKTSPKVSEDENPIDDNDEIEPEMDETAAVSEALQTSQSPTTQTKKPENVSSSGYKKLISELTAEPELRSSLKRKSSVMDDKDTASPTKTKVTSTVRCPAKGTRSYSRKDYGQSPKQKPTHELVGLTTRSGKKLIKQEIDDTPMPDPSMSDSGEAEEGEVTMHAVLLNPVTKKEKEDGEIDYSMMDEDDEGTENENSFEDIDDQDTPETDRVGRRSSRRRGRPKKDDDFDMYFGIDAAMPKKYSCSTCDFQTNKVREMSSHNKLHKLEQNTCFYCEQKFDDHEILTQHMEKHKGPNPFFCSVCDSRFKTRTQLNLHLPKHSDEKPFICEICSQGFKWKHALKSHMITHSNKKDHLCDTCGYATAHKSQLKAHRLIHTGQTYKCEFPGCPFQVNIAFLLLYIYLQL